MFVDASALCFHKQQHDTAHSDLNAKASELEHKKMFAEQQI